MPSICELLSELVKMYVSEQTNRVSAHSCLHIQQYKTYSLSLKSWEETNSDQNLKPISKTQTPSQFFHNFSIHKLTHFSFLATSVGQQKSLELHSL